MDDAERNWLARTAEEPLEPELAICDPHHHLWDFPTDRYLLDELRGDTGAGHNVVSTVFVECTSAYRSRGPEELRPVGETEFVAAAAAESERRAGAEIKGIVSFADLSLGEAVRPVLEAHVEAGQGRFRGIRHATAWDRGPGVRVAHTAPPPGLMGEPGFQEGVAELGRLGLSFDAWLYHPQLVELANLARVCPDVRIVLDHLGAPLGLGPYAGHRDEVLAAWRSGMEAVAACPNVVLKVGGIGLPLYGFEWHKNDKPPTSEELAVTWGPEIRWCIELFGPERAMFESNFPVDRKSTSYVVLWNAFKRIAAGASPAEKADLFHDSAARAYRLK
ncbi:MAG: amidohydrolase family protein [Acidimicrobiia bacterium]|nr:amidohydrolase family protein [Acidimicrobiia bacterium]